MASNGQLPASMLRSIPGGRLEAGAAASWLRMRAHIGAKTGVWICPTSSRCCVPALRRSVVFLAALHVRPGFAGGASWHLQPRLGNHC